MYVLPHADQPALYAGLPRDPKISPLVYVWKSAAKRYASLAAMAAVVVAMVVHQVAAGPNRNTDEDEEKARQLIEGKDK